MKRLWVLLLVPMAVMICSITFTVKTESKPIALPPETARVATEPTLVRFVGAKERTVESRLPYAVTSNQRPAHRIRRACYRAVHEFRMKPDESGPPPPCQRQNRFRPQSGNETACPINIFVTRL